MKIKNVRLLCQVCNKLASTQVFYNKSGEIKYARSRHYLGVSNGKPQFGYHQQSLDYLKANLGHDQLTLNDDLNKGEASFVLKLEPSAGFGPATITLPR
jgi:hypothetical protein